MSINTCVNNLKLNKDKKVKLNSILYEVIYGNIGSSLLFKHFNEKQSIRRFLKAISAIDIVNTKLPINQKMIMNDMDFDENIRNGLKKYIQLKYEAHKAMLNLTNSAKSIEINLADRNAVNKSSNKKNYENLIEELIELIDDYYLVDTYDIYQIQFSNTNTTLKKLLNIPKEV